MKFLTVEELRSSNIENRRFSNAQKIYDFLTAVKTAFNDEKPVLAVIHKKSNYPFISSIKDRNDVLIFEISPENRDLIYNEVLNILKK